MPPRPLIWARLPSDWIRYRDGLKTFPPADATRAQGVTSLKLYLAILALAAEQEIQSGGPAGEARVTYDELGERAAVSRGLLPEGLNLLSGHIQRVSGSGRESNRYRILGYDEKGFAQLPVRWIWHSEGNVLKQFSAHRRSDLNALKLYLLLLAHRKQATNTTTLTYEKMTEYTGLHPPQISEGLTVLASASLIRVAPGLLTDNEEEEIDLSARKKTRPPNVYRFPGLRALSRST